MSSATLHTQTVDLGRDQLMVIDGGHGARVRVLCGAAWLTQEGEDGDAVLHQADELVLHPGRTLIQALQTARVQVSSRPVRPLVALRALLRHWAARLHLGPAAAAPLG